MTDEKIQFIADNLQESLEVEVKNWLNGLQAKSDKAILAREIIALANHGGSYIFIGFDDKGATFPEIAPALGELEAFTQDVLAGIVHRYVTPPCQCRLDVVTPSGSSQPHPVVIVPGEHRTPLFAARGGPNGELDPGKVYARRPGGYSEAARTQDDWEKLIERLVKARQTEMLGAIREIINPSSKLLPDNELTLEDWHQENYTAWHNLVSAFDADDPRRLQAGHWAISFSIASFHTCSLGELNSALDRDMPKYSGWPPFTYLHRDPVRPRAEGDSVIAYIGDLGPGESPEDRVERSDYWRVSRDGQGFMLRPMPEDRSGYLANVYPRPEAPFFDWVIPIYRMMEVLKFVEDLAGRFGEPSASFQLLLVYQNTYGRHLEESRHRYYLDDGATCHVNSISSGIEAPVSQIATNIEELLYSLLAPVYEQFDFTELPRQLVTSVVGEQLGTHG